MFNVSLKVSNDNLVEIQNVMEVCWEAYQKHLREFDPHEWYIYWSNFQNFRLKVANKLFSKQTTDPSKEYRLSINVNSWKAFKDFWQYLQGRKILFNPYHEAVMYDLSEQANKQLALKSNLYQLNVKKMN